MYAHKTIELTKGEDRTITFTIERDGAPLDITGAYCYLAVRRAEGDSVIYSIDNDPAGTNTGVTLTDPSNGIFEAVIAHTAFTSEAAGDLIYGALLRLAPGGSDDRFDIARGKLVLRENRVIVP